MDVFNPLNMDKRYDKDDVATCSLITRKIFLQDFLEILKRIQKDLCEYIEHRGYSAILKHNKRHHVCKY